MSITNFIWPLFFLFLRYTQALLVGLSSVMVPLSTSHRTEKQELLALHQLINWSIAGIHDFSSYQSWSFCLHCSKLYYEVWSYCLLSYFFAVILGTIFWLRFSLSLILKHTRLLFLFAKMNIELLIIRIPIVLKNVCGMSSVSIIKVRLPLSTLWLLVIFHISVGSFTQCLSYTP